MHQLSVQPSDFFIGLDRAMISLGPLSSKRFCSYSCAFCYVHSSFTKYPVWSIDEIVSWLRKHRSEYSIIYISGDTDSFAKPRTADGLELLRRLVELNCDVLFTTRAVLDRSAVSEIKTVNDLLRQNDLLLIACVSISRLRSAAHIEPRPISMPEIRIDVLRRLKDAGIATVLAMRPFLPIIPAHEYCELVELSRDAVDAVLGEAWYFDAAGKLEDMVLGKGIRFDKFRLKEMDFDRNGNQWKVWDAVETADVVRDYCDALGIPFFMRSAPAIELLRNKFLDRI